VPKNLKSIPNVVTRVELGNLLENFKTYILNTISDQLDTLRIKRKQEEERAAMAIFYPKCKRKHMEREFPINVVEVCGINFPWNNSTEKCPTFPRFQAIYKGNMEANDPSQTNKKPSWKGPNQNMYQDPNPQTFIQNQPWNFQPSYPP